MEYDAAALLCHAASGAAMLVDLRIGMSAKRCLLSYAGLGKGRPLLGTGGFTRMA